MLQALNVPRFFGESRIVCFYVFCFFFFGFHPPLNDVQAFGNSRLHDRFIQISCHMINTVTGQKSLGKSKLNAFVFRCKKAAANLCVFNRCIILYFRCSLLLLMLVSLSWNPMYLHNRLYLFSGRTVDALSVILKKYKGRIFLINRFFRKMKVRQYTYGQKVKAPNQQNQRTDPVGAGHIRTENT
jgi:hypothetical protein